MAHPGWSPLFGKYGVAHDAGFDSLQDLGPDDVLVLMLIGRNVSPGRAWATQGVLSMGAESAQQALEFIRALAPPFVVLWGEHDDAAALAPRLTHRWASSADFAGINAALQDRGLRPIEWDSDAPTRAFTDGSCPRNGDPAAEAAFAVFVDSGPLKGVQAAGRVAPHEYAFIDEADPLRGFAPVSSTKAIPTNNRGEYLAWCWCLLLLLRGGVRGRVEIVSDCNLFIQTMKTWLPARRIRGSERELKNFDLILIADRLLVMLRAAAGVQLTHVKAHQRRPPSTDSRAYALWSGNNQADAAARALLNGPELFVINSAATAFQWNLLTRWDQST